MSTYYDLYETPDPSGEGKKKPLHARVRSKGTITAKEFQERMVKEQHMPHAMIVGIMQAIRNALACRRLQCGIGRTGLLQHYAEMHADRHEQERYSCRVRTV